MRKDKKFGWIAGGVLVAVMVVYLIMATGSRGDKDAQPVELVKQVAPDAAQEADAQTSRSADVASADAPSGQEYGADSFASSTGTGAAAPQTEKVSQGDRSSSSDVWGSLLNTGRTPDGMLLTQTPRIRPAADSVSMATVSSDMPDVGMAQANAPLSEQALASTDLPAQANTSHATAGTHVVRQGETLSSIAADTYGSAVYWSHIARANPSVNPRRLKVGTVLTLPDASVVTAGAHSAAAASAVSLDPTKQYQVQANDSLYKISLKLYGSPSFVDQIYDLNKKAIGSNPAHLKLNMVLQLPKAPTQGTH